MESPKKRTYGSSELKGLNSPPKRIKTFGPDGVFPTLSPLDSDAMALGETDPLPEWDTKLPNPVYSFDPNHVFNWKQIVHGLEQVWGDSKTAADDDNTDDVKGQPVARRSIVTISDDEVDDCVLHRGLMDHVMCPWIRIRVNYKHQSEEVMKRKAELLKAMTSDVVFKPATLEWNEAVNSDDQWATIRAALLPYCSGWTMSMRWPWFVTSPFENLLGRIRADPVLNRPAKDYHFYSGQYNLNATPIFWEECRRSAHRFVLYGSTPFFGAGDEKASQQLRDTTSALSEFKGEAHDFFQELQSRNPKLYKAWTHFQGYFNADLIAPSKLLMLKPPQDGYASLPGWSELERTWSEGKETADFTSYANQMASTVWDMADMLPLLDDVTGKLKAKMTERLERAAKQRLQLPEAIEPIDLDIVTTIQASHLIKPFKRQIFSSPTTNSPISDVLIGLAIQHASSGVGHINHSNQLQIMAVPGQLCRGRFAMLDDKGIEALTREHSRFFVVVCADSVEKMRTALYEFYSRVCRI